MVVSYTDLTFRSTAFLRGRRALLEPRVVHARSLAMLTVDETVDDGIILEVDSKTIVNRVLMQGADGSVKDITDMTISQAMEVAREQLLKNVV